MGRPVGCGCLEVACHDDVVSEGPVATGERVAHRGGHPYREAVTPGRIPVDTQLRPRRQQTPAPHGGVRRDEHVETAAPQIVVPSDADAEERHLDYGAHTAVHVA